MLCLSCWVVSEVQNHPSTERLVSEVTPSIGWLALGDHLSAMWLAFRVTLFMEVLALALTPSLWSILICLMQSHSLCSFVPLHWVFCMQQEVVLCLGVCCVFSPPSPWREKAERAGRGGVSNN